MSFIEEMKMRAKKDIKTIVLPEASDVRTLDAANGILKDGFARIILIGNKKEILEKAKERNLNLEKAEIIDPKTYEKYDEFVTAFFELRKKKGITIEKAKTLMLDTVYFGMMMVKLRICRLFSIWSNSFNSRYIKTCSSNFKDSTKHKISFCFLFNGSTKL